MPNVEDSLLILELIPRLPQQEQEASQRSSDTNQTLLSKSFAASTSALQAASRSNQAIAKLQPEPKGPRRSGYCTCNLYKVVLGDSPGLPVMQEEPSSFASLCQVVKAKHVTEQTVLDAMKLEIEDAVLEQVIAMM
eukprot:4225-Hanusia_phi.AAC.1